MGYANFQQLLNDIQNKFLNNNTRLITEPVMRQVQTDISTFFQQRIIDYYNRQEADDDDYTVLSAPEDPPTGNVNILDSVLLLPIATEFRQVILPANVAAGNHLLIFVKDSPTIAADAGKFYWQTNLLMVDQYEDPHSNLKPGHNFLLWPQNGGSPILFYMGWDSRLNVIPISTPISLVDITETLLNATFSHINMGQEIHFDNLTDAPSNIAIVYRTATGWGMNTSSNKVL